MNIIERFKICPLFYAIKHFAIPPFDNRFKLTLTFVCYNCLLVQIVMLLVFGTDLFSSGICTKQVDDVMNERGKS